MHFPNPIAGRNAHWLALVCIHEIIGHKLSALRTEGFTDILWPRVHFKRKEARQCLTLQATVAGDGSFGTVARGWCRGPSAILVPGNQPLTRSQSFAVPNFRSTSVTERFDLKLPLWGVGEPNQCKSARKLRVQVVFNSWDTNNNKIS